MSTPSLAKKKCDAARPSGQAASDIGLEGLLVPSAAEPNGQNIIAFPRNLIAPSNVAMLSPGGG